MIGSTVDKRYVLLKRHILKGKSTDIRGRNRPQCICSSRDLFPLTTICPRHQQQIKARQAYNPPKNKDQKEAP